jgi:hypothetical protein
MQDISFDLKSYKLDNGLLCYFVYPKHPARPDGAMICLSVKAGSAYEKCGEKGWFHFLEHMLVFSDIRNPNDYFKIFRYAHTSFYETAFFFSANESSVSLLENSLITAKGILDGIFLDKSTFMKNQKDVINELHYFMRKAWFVPCNKQLKEIGAAMPIGEPEDIIKADFEKLMKKHSDYYYEGNAALIIFTPHDTHFVVSMVNDIFRHNKALINNGTKIERQCSDCVIPKAKSIKNSQSYVLLAWHPRQMLPALLTLERYILLATLARAVEISLSEKRMFFDPECNVEVFNHKKYMFKLDVSMKRNSSVSDLWEIVHNTDFTAELFAKAKKLIRKQLYASYSGKFTKMHVRDLIDSCRENFLFGEPFINVENEYEKSLGFISNLKYEKVKNDFINIMRQFSIHLGGHQNQKDTKESK